MLPEPNEYGQTMGARYEQQIEARARRFRRPSYLRVVVTRACPMHCPFCHHEGVGGNDGAVFGAGRSRPGFADWHCMLDVAARAGIRKFKFLGGEPLLEGALPALIAGVKSACLEADVSVITSGAVPVEMLEACFAAGLDRANLSIHGWTWEAFRANGGTVQYAQRRAVLERLLVLGRPLKLNFVYLGEASEQDLGVFLKDLSGERFTSRPVTVSILDDLGNAEMSPETIREVLRRLLGEPREKWVDDDPSSLPAERWRWRSGLTVEIKSSILGELAPWVVCETCPKRKQCREGTFALRLEPSGDVRFCMDRPDLRFSLLEACRADPGRAVDRWEAELCAMANTRPVVPPAMA